MDCNKDGAIRAKELAEKKLAEMDAVEARRFALMAKNLFPELDGLPQLLAALDVYISTDEKINGEVDWYRVLGVQPDADEETIRKHYRKLALILHPDKNKSVGADGAFKILSQAWTVLSDKERRTAYDEKRNLRGSYSDVFHGKPSTEATSSNGFHDFFNVNNSKTVDQNGATYSNPAPPHSARSDTFWTTCYACKMNFEYSRVYVNMNLTCWKCRTPFFAAETSTPSINGNSKYTPLSNFMQQQKFHQVQNSGRGRFSGLGASKKFSQAGAFAGSASNINVAPPSSFATRAAGATHSASKTLKRRHKESKAGTRTGESLQIRVPSHKTHAGLGTRSSGSVSRTAAKKPRSKKRHTGTTEIENPIAMGNEGASLSSIQKNGSNIRRTDASGISSNSIKEPPRLGIRNMLMEMARREICKNTNSWTPALPNASNKPKVSDEELEEQNEGNRKDAPSKKPGAKKSTEFVDIKSSMQTKMSSVADSDVDPATRGPEPVSMSVPDPDFHDFDQDRMEKSFGENQVWAAYDDDDGMPRYYAMIHSVISLKPFKMRMSWLNSKSNAELGPLNWIGSGFFKTSGEFWIGKYGVNRSLNSFSHKVKWSKGRKGVIQIYPRKGDVWALYRNWSSDWNSLTPSEVIHNYDMVEVLEDYNEQNGVAISPLVKVPGFKTVFRKHSKPSKPWVIPREELFRFSHQVPSYLLTGQEGQKSCEGRLELDPAATPLELLQVFTEDQVKEMETMIERAREDALNVDSKRSKGKELVEDDQETKPKITDEGVGQAKETENKKAGLLVYVRRHPKKSDS